MNMDQYLEIYSLPGRMYTVGSPVVVIGGELLRDRYSDATSIMLEMLNIFNKIIISAKVEIIPLDDTGKIRGDSFIYYYYGIYASRGDTFGTQTFISIPDKLVKRFRVAVIEVSFTDETKWVSSSKEAEWKFLREQRAIQDSTDDQDLIKQSRYKYGNQCKYVPLKCADLWFCCCGEINRKEEETCYNWSTPQKIVYDFDLDALHREKNERLQNEFEEERDYYDVENDVSQPSVNYTSADNSIIKTVLAAIGVIAIIAILVIGRNFFLNTISGLVIDDSDEATDSTEALETDSNDASQESDVTVEDEQTDNSVEVSVSDYAEANVLSIEYIGVAEYSSSYIIWNYKVTNSGTDPIDYIDITFGFFDSDGNQLDTTYSINNSQLQSGKWAIMTVYYFADEDDDLPDAPTPTNYTYFISDMWYEVRLQTEFYECYVMDPDDNIVDFETADILEFTGSEIEIDSFEYYDVDIQIENVGEQEVVEVVYSVVFYDADGNQIDTNEGTTIDTVIEPGKYIIENVFGSVFESVADDYEIDSYAVFEYSYMLAETDEYGNNYYSVDLQSEEAYGYYEEDGILW